MIYISNIILISSVYDPSGCPTVARLYNPAYSCTTGYPVTQLYGKIEAIPPKTEVLYTEQQ